MSQIKWKESKVEGRVGVSVPYRQLFNDELRAMVPSAKFEKDRLADGIWYFDEEALHLVRLLLDKYYLNTKWYRVEWQLNRSETLEIDGCNLLYVNRDYWKWRDSGFEMKIVACDLQSGGSRRRPDVSGCVVLEIALRDDAVIEPEPVSMEAIAPAPPPNPLATIPTEMLVNELGSRGLGYLSSEQVRTTLKSAIGAIEIAGNVEAGRDLLEHLLGVFDETWGAA